MGAVDFVTSPAAIADYEARHYEAVEAGRGRALNASRHITEAIKALPNLEPVQLAQICCVLSAKVDQSNWSHLDEGLSEHLDSAADMATDIHNRQHAL